MYYYGAIEEVAIQLMEKGLIEFKEQSPGGKGFRLKQHETNPEAPLSPFYIDLRKLRSLPDLMNKVVSLYRQKIRELKDYGFRFNLLADIPTAATPIVSILSYKLEMPMITPREPKSHGTGAKIDGIFKVNDLVLLIDDLITKADSKIAAIEILESQGLIVKHVLVLVDREQGGAEQLSKKGYQLHSIFQFSELLDFYRDKGKIPPKTYQEIKTYLGR